jgi:hypothetical protein
MSFIMGIVLLVVGAWLYRIGVQYERRHGRKRK